MRYSQFKNVKKGDKLKIIANITATDKKDYASQIVTIMSTTSLCFLRYVKIEEDSGFNDWYAEDFEPIAGASVGYIDAFEEVLGDDRNPLPSRQDILKIKDACWLAELISNYENKTIYYIKTEADDLGYITETVESGVLKGITRLQALIEMSDGRIENIPLFTVYTAKHNAEESIRK